MPLINYATRIQFEFGALRFLSEECERLGIQRPLLVTDRGVQAAGLVDKVLDAMRGLTVAVFDGTPPNPSEKAVRLGAHAYTQAGCDGLVALGGGSSIDCAKGIAIAVAHEGPLKNYAAVEDGEARISDRTPPLVAIPTTSGTGSEVARAAVLIVDDRRKLVFRSDRLRPRAAICDPELTLGLPPTLTAATGMDAIAHCIETFLSPSFNPPADGIALDGLERGWRHIERAARHPEDREARLNLMSASLEGALAFPKGLGCVHSLSHGFGAQDPRLHHGTLNALLLPAVIRFNAAATSVRREQRMERIARAMGLGSGSEVADAISAMNARLGLPSGLDGLGVASDHVDEVIDAACADPCHATNPRNAERGDYREIIEASR